MKNFFEAKKPHDLVLKILIEQSKGKICSMGCETRSDSSCFYENLKTLSDEYKNTGWNRFYRDSPDLIVPCLNIVVEVGVHTLRKDSILTGNILIDFHKSMLLYNLSKDLQQNYIYLAICRDLVVSNSLQDNCTIEQMKKHLPMCILTTGRNIVDSIDYYEHNYDKNFVKSLIPGYWYKGSEYLQKIINGEKFEFSKNDIIGKKESLAELKNFAKQFEQDNNDSTKSGD